ncbi:hypothetical protein [Streptomyces sp. cg40]|uniref:hypothetical protein n=1 Tax=Streptomyces sp. cg40 TaxID=3419764 RepID=UPI003CFEAD53
MSFRLAGRSACRAGSPGVPKFAGGWVQPLSQEGSPTMTSAEVGGGPEATPDGCSDQLAV